MKKLFSLFILSILLAACSSDTPGGGGGGGGGGDPVPPKILNINKTLPTISNNVLTGYVDFIPGEVNFGKTDEFFKTFLNIYYKDMNNTAVKFRRYEDEEDKGAVYQNGATFNFPIYDVDQYIRKGSELNVDVNGAKNTDFTEGTCFERFYMDIDYAASPPVPGVGLPNGRGVTAVYRYQGDNTFKRVGYVVYDAIMNSQGITNYYIASKEGNFCDGSEISMETR